MATEFAPGRAAYIALGEHGDGRPADCWRLGIVRATVEEARADAAEWLASCYPPRGEVAYVRRCDVESVDDNGAPDRFTVDGAPVAELAN